MQLRRMVTVAVVGGFLVVGGSGPAFAHDCTNTQKPVDSAGIAGTYNIATDTFTPNGSPGNPGFVLLVFPDGSTYLTFSHSGGAKHDYVVPGAKNCDGKGLDSLEACFGG